MQIDSVGYQGQLKKFEIPKNFIKFKESVYEGYENFTYKQVDYEITDYDLKFLKEF